MDGLLPADVPLFDGTGRSSTITRELMRSAPIPPANGWIDPSVEIAAYVDAIKNNLTTKREVLSTLGRDWEQTFNDRAEEVARESELGIAPPDSVSAPQSVPEPDGESDTGEGDGGETPEPVDQEQEQEVGA
jgi:capsid protein